MSELKEKLVELLKWTPLGVDLKAISKVNYPEKYFPRDKYGEICTSEDCKAPFFSEAYAYNLLGKQDARTLIGLMHSICEAIGVDMDKIVY